MVLFIGCRLDGVRSKSTVVDCKDRIVSLREQNDWSLAYVAREKSDILAEDYVLIKKYFQNVTTHPSNYFYFGEMFLP